MFITMFRIKFISILFILSNFLPAVQAANVTYRAGISYGMYDNINLVSQPTEKEVSQGLSVGLRVIEDSSNLLANFNANFSTFNYKNDIAADRNYGQLLANVIWRIKPGHFEWVFNNNFTQSVIDPLASDSPSNRQNVNVISTGPNYILRLNPRNNLQLEARVENYNYQVYADNNRASTAIRWLHTINSAFVVSLNNESELARFDNETVNLDFQRNDLFIGANYTRGENVLLAEYGVSSIKNEYIEDISSDRYLLSITNSRTRTSSVRFVYLNYLSNTGNQVLRLDPGDNGDGPPIDTVANDVFVNEGYRIQYNKNITNGVIGVNLFTDTRRYERSTALDIDYSGFSANIRWYLRRNSSFVLGYRQIETDYVDPGSLREDADKIYSAQYRYSIKRNLSVGLLASQLERISTIDTRSYEDFRILITLNFFSI